MKKKVIVLMGIDDFNPGVLDLKSTEMKNLKIFLKNHPELKVTGFCTPVYSFNNNPFLSFLKRRFSKLKKQNKINEENRLGNNIDWVDNVGLIENIVLEIHGLTHFNERKISAGEFDGLGKRDTYERIYDGMKEFKSVGLRPKVFCPPGWAMNPHIYSYCEDHSMKLANSFYNLKDKKYSGAKLKTPYKPQFFRRVKCIPRNIDIHSGTFDEVKELVKNEGVIAFHSHAKNIGVKNGLTKENLDNLSDILKQMELKYIIKYEQFRDM